MMDARTHRIVALVACSASKLDHRAPARELYSRSDLFTKALAWGEAFADQALILSAEHGLVELDQELDPYNTRLPRQKAAQDLWGRRVLQQLVRKYQGMRGPVSFVVLAGKDYRLPLYRTATAVFQELQVRGSHGFLSLYEQLEGIGAIKAMLLASVAKGKPLHGTAATCSAQDYTPEEFRAWLTAVSGYQFHRALYPHHLAGGE